MCRICLFAAKQHILWYVTLVDQMMQDRSEVGRNRGVNRLVSSDVRMLFFGGHTGIGADLGFSSHAIDAGWGWLVVSGACPLSAAKLDRMIPGLVGDTTDAHTPCHWVVSSSVSGVSVPNRLTSLPSLKAALIGLTKCSFAGWCSLVASQIVAVLAETGGVVVFKPCELFPKLGCRPVGREEFRGQYRIDQEMPQYLGSDDEPFGQAVGARQVGLKASRFGRPGVEVPEGGGELDRVVLGAALVERALF